MPDLDDLADDEIYARLIHKGVPELQARWLVRHRDEPEAVSNIRQELTDRWNNL